MAFHWQLFFILVLLIPVTELGRKSFSFEAKCALKREGIPPGVWTGMRLFLHFCIFRILLLVVIVMTAFVGGIAIILPLSFVPQLMGELDRSSPLLAVVILLAAIIVLALLVGHAGWIAWDKWGVQLLRTAINFTGAICRSDQQLVDWHLRKVLEKQLDFHGRGAS